MSYQLPTDMLECQPTDILEYLSTDMLECPPTYMLEYLPTDMLECLPTDNAVEEANIKNQMVPWPLMSSLDSSNEGYNLDEVKTRARS
jgi:hypothetical protein